MALDKVGLHLVGALTVRNLGRARVVKLASCSVQDFRDARAAVGPRCLLIWRHVLTESEQPLDNPLARAQQFVARWQSEMLTIKGAVGLEVAFEGYNEIAGTNAANFNAFECERLRLMHNLGLRSVVGNFAVGNPAWDQWPVYAPMLNALRSDDYLGLHDYWAVPTDIDDPYYCGRWRLNAGLKAVPILVTECGRDEIKDRVRRNLWPGTAWREAGISAATYLNELRRYDDFIAQYSNVLGATVFTEGSNWDWTNRYGVAELWPQVVASYSNPQVYPTVPVAVPVPPPPATPTFGWSERNGAPITHIIYHGAEGHNVKAYFASYDARVTRKVSAHYAIERSGRVDTIVPEDKAAWHCGGSIIPGWTGDPNDCTIGVEMACDASPAAPGWSEAQIQSAIALGKDITKRRPIPRVCVKRHSDVDARHRDPRDFPWQRVLDGIYGPVELPHEGLPTDEICTDTATIFVKSRYWVEVTKRALQEGRTQRALDILDGLIDPNTGLMYRA